VQHTVRHRRNAWNILARATTQRESSGQDEAVVADVEELRVQQLLNCYSDEAVCMRVLVKLASACCPAAVHLV
jgi:hypothetical protein